MEKIERVVEHRTFKDVVELVEDYQNYYKEHRIFVRRESWTPLLFWETSNGGKFGYKLCTVNENCMLSYLSTETQFTVEIDSAISSDWEIWIEVRF